MKVLFLCTGNSCRSQMAEGWCRFLRGDDIEAFSAGTKPKSLDPRAVAVMAEVGVDISGQRSKSVKDFVAADFDVIVTVCDGAREACPVLPGARRVVHRGFDDPPSLAETASTEEEMLAAYRRVRDEIRRFVQTLPGSLEGDDAHDVKECLTWHRKLA